MSKFLAHVVERNWQRKEINTVLGSQHLGGDWTRRRSANERRWLGSQPKTRLANHTWDKTEKNGGKSNRFDDEFLQFLSELWKTKNTSG